MDEPNQTQVLVITHSRAHGGNVISTMAEPATALLRGLRHRVLLKRLCYISL